MRVTSLSRTIAALAALILAGACHDTSGPDSQGPDLSTGGMTLIPRSATIRSGEVVVLKATPIDANGGRPAVVGISWTSTNEAVATVTARGEVFGRGAGHAIITASAPGWSQFSTIQVLARSLKPDSEPGKPGLKDGKKVK